MNTGCRFNKPRKSSRHKEGQDELEHSPHRFPNASPCPSNYNTQFEGCIARRLKHALQQHTNSATTRIQWHRLTTTYAVLPPVHNYPPSSYPHCERIQLTHTPFAVARVKKIIHADDDIGNCSNNAAFVIAVATEMFVQHLTEQIYNVVKSERRPRRTVAYRDVGKLWLQQSPVTSRSPKAWC